MAVNGTETRGNGTETPNKGAAIGGKRYRNSWKRYRDRCIVATVPIVVVGYGAEPAGGRWWREPDLLGRRPHEQLPCRLQVRLEATLGTLRSAAAECSHPLGSNGIRCSRGGCTWGGAGMVGWGGKWSGEVRHVLAHNLGLTLNRDWAHLGHTFTGTGLAPCHICAGTELAPCHICAGTATQMRDGPAPAAVLVQVGRRAHARADRRDRPVERAHVRQPRGHGAAVPYCGGPVNGIADGSFHTYT